MKVLLTGASGFVGSHILDSLRALDIPTVLLLRPTSDKTALTPHLPYVQIRPGSIADVSSVQAALEDVTHVVHCAGCTKARNKDEFHAVNEFGTANVVNAVNSNSSKVVRLLHISSLAVAGPATAVNPAREDRPPAPVSDYGKSKLAGELQVKGHCKVPYTIIRPPAVYGPRDKGFLPMFKAVKAHVRPQPSATQSLSLVYGPDLAKAIVGCLQHPAAAGKTYFVSSPEVVTGGLMANEIAAQMGHWTIPCPLPPALLWPMCLGQEVISRLSGRAMLLNLQKYAELRAPGWVCDSTRLKVDTGQECLTTLKLGVAETLAWYSRHGWI